MTSDKLRNIDRVIDRHGKPPHYHRRSKGARTQLPGEPGSDEFATAYVAVAGDGAAKGSSVKEPDYSAPIR